MTTFLLAAAATVLATVAVGLVRVLRGPSAADRMMAAQLLGTGGIAAMVLLAVATGTDGALDVALVLALLSPFAAVALVRTHGGVDRRGDGTEKPGASNVGGDAIIDRTLRRRAP